MLIIIGLFSIVLSKGIALDEHRGSPNIRRTSRIKINPLPYKRTGDIAISPVDQKNFLLPVQFFVQKFVARPVFLKCFPLKNYRPAPKLVARPFIRGGMYKFFFLNIYLKEDLVYLNLITRTKIIMQLNEYKLGLCQRNAHMSD